MSLLSHQLMLNTRFSFLACWGKRNFKDQRDGFSLVEVLVALVVLTVASAGSIAAFNATTQAIRATEARSDQNRLIDQNVAQITRISETFTSCMTPSGINPVNPDIYCTGTGVAFRNSFYYFPEISNPADSATWTNATSFRSACDNGTLRSNFITALGGGSAVNLNGSNGSALVTRQPIVAVSNSNHLVQITWTVPGDSTRILRQIRVVPIVSTWCP